MADGNSHARNAAPWWTDLVACPRCKGPLRRDADWRCDVCACAYGECEGRPMLMLDRAGAPIENAVVESQRRAREQASRTGLRALADKLRAAADADIFADDRKQVRLLTDAVAGTLPEGAVVDIGACEQYYRADLERLGPVLALDVAVYGPTDLLGDAHQLPLRDNVASVVCVIEVLEHLRRPWQFFAEAARVLKPGGVLIGVAPQYCPTHGFPYDFFRYTRGGITALAEDAGLHADRLWPLGGSWGTLLHWYWANHARESALRKIPGVGVAYHAYFQGVAWGLDLLDARAGRGERALTQVHNDHVGWSFVLRKPAA